MAISMKRTITASLVATFLGLTLMGCRPVEKEHSDPSTSIWERIGIIGPFIALRSYKKAFEERKTCGSKPKMEDQVKCEANYFRQLCDFVDSVNFAAAGSPVLAKEAPQSREACSGTPSPLPFATDPIEPQVCFYDYCEGEKPTGNKIDKGRVCFKSGAIVPNVGPFWNDNFARIELIGGVKVKAFKHNAFRGRSFQWAASEGCIGKSLRDDISSFYVFK